LIEHRAWLLWLRPWQRLFQTRERHPFLALGRAHPCARTVRKSLCQVLAEQLNGRAGAARGGKQTTVESISTILEPYPGSQHTNPMDALRRKQYLDALGIPVWQSRKEDPHPSALPKGEGDEERSSPLPLREAAAPAADGGLIAGMDWETLAATVKDCTRCRLRACCKQTVFGVGLKTAPLLVIGEGPGADEDRIGEPFVGRAGKLLDSMLLAIGRDRKAVQTKQSVYIANIVKCRPPDNRDPQPDEAAACRPYLERQIELIQPKLILAVGRIAAQNLLMTDAPIGKLRGPVHQYGPSGIPVIVTYHPAYLLRSPREKGRAWDDLKRARALLRDAA
jgi:DNA polymerase